MTGPAARDLLVLGAGSMGHGIAVCFAGAGWSVTLYDPQRAAIERAQSAMRAALVLLAEHSAAPSDVESVMDRVTMTSALPERVAGLVIECVPEILELKRDSLRHIEARADSGTLLCTNTSAIRIDDIAEALESPERLIGTHFWNPPYILPCVEVVPGSRTAEANVAQVMDLLRAAGRKPVRLQRDVPGFVGNRLQHALQREALALVEAGVISAVDLDAIVTGSFGQRLALMGPFERADLGGIDTTARVHEYLLPYLDARQTPSPLLKAKVDAGDLGIKTGQGFYAWSAGAAEARVAQRDRRLLRLQRLLSDTETEADA